MGRAEKNAVLSDLRVLLLHLLKWQYQPRRTSSWINTIYTQRDELDLRLTATLKRYLEENFKLTYAKARRSAARETMPLEIFPLQCPFSVTSVLDENFFPDQHN